MHRGGGGADRGWDRALRGGGGGGGVGGSGGREGLVLAEVEVGLSLFSNGDGAGKGKRAVAGGDVDVWGDLGAVL